MKSNFESALAILGDKIGLDMGLDEAGTVALAADEVELGLRWLDGPEDIHVYAIIGEIPDDAGVAFYRVLMAANHMGDGTSGGGIGIDLESGIATLNRRVPGSWIDAARLETLIEEFSDLAGLWQQNFTELVNAAAEADATDPDTPPSDASDAWIKM